MENKLGTTRSNSEHRCPPFEWNNTDRDYPRDKCVHELFEEQAARTPNAVAVVFEEQSLTYAELNAHANQLAHHLQSLGVGPEILVGLCVDRSFEMVVGLIGILKASGAYVPLDPKLPQQRLRFLVADAGMSLVLTTRTHFAILQQATGDKTQPEQSPRCRIIAIEDLLTSDESPPVCNLPTVNCQLTAPTSPVYVNYTSGSTGEPRGVLVPHRGVVRLVKSANYVSLTAEDTLLQLSTLSFDASTFEIWGALLNGARLILMPPHQPSLTEIGDAIRKNHVTTLWLTAGLFHLMVDERLDDLGPLRQLLAGGDVLSVDHVLRAKRALPNCRIINGYGPTENTTFTCCYTVGEESDLIPSVPIGHPVSNTQVYLLDAEKQPVPQGVVGELYTGGDGLACGYLNAPELTAERFVANPFNDAPGSRLYRTGDLARYRPDGNFEFIGRTDHQVKIRGFRIETGEVEAALRGLLAIRDAVVVAKNESNGVKHLIAYLVMACDVKPCSNGQAGTTDISLAEMRSQLSLKLPDYMIPSQFVVVPEFPLTPNGKLDRKALLSPGGTELTSGSDYEAPRNELEQQLAAIWQAVLKREQIGIRDNFFELGGHSLLAVMVGARITQELGLHVPLRLLFQHPVIAELALHLQTETAGTSAVGRIPRIPRDQPLPASFAQQRMWLLQQMLPDPATYNVPVAWRFTGDVDAGRLQQCLQQLMQRHEILRTSFAMQGEQLTQRISAAADLPLPWNTIDPLSPSSRQSPSSSSITEVKVLLSKHLRDESRHLFDLTKGPLWRAAWLSVAANDHVLVLTFHHSIVDEWSLRLLREELQQLYITEGSPDATALPTLAVQYADYSVWRRQQLIGERLEFLRQYWRDQLHDLPEALELPADLPRPQRPTGQGAIHEFELAASVVQPLRELARQEGTTLFTVLLTAFHVWLHRYTQQTDIVVATPHTTRNHPELEAVFGFFLNTLPVRARLERGLSFRETVRQVHNTLMSAYSHAELPFEQMVELAVHDRHSGQHPLHQVMFVLLEESVPALRLGQSTGQSVFVGTDTSKCDLTLSVLNTEGEWICQWEYDTDLFVPETVTRMSDHWTQMLTSVVENPEQSIGRLELMSAAERHQVLVEWNDTDRDYPRDKCVHELFEEQAARTPDSVAVVFEDQSLTYAELNARANQLAHHLQSLGVGPEVLVGLCVDRSLEMVVGLLGILKAGGAYVPLDPKLPEERLRFLVADAELSLILATRTHLVILQQVTGNKTEPDVASCCSTIIIEDLLSSDEPTPDGSLATVKCQLTTPTSPVYVNYTSGSTGEPRGVLVPHRGVVRLVKSANYVSLTAEDTLLQLSTLSFDAATFEIWGALLNGARLVLMPRHQASLIEIGDAIRRYQVTTLWLTAGLFHLMVDERLDDLRPLKQLLAGGDVLSVDRVLRAKRALPNCRIINGYGPTENTTFTCCYTVGEESDLIPSVPIGRPVSNTQVYLLDADQNPVPTGGVGELYTGGDGLACCYLNAAELTAERFVSNPFSDEPGSRLYRTGDLARYRPDGNLEFIGRTDQQVKIRGFRIEIGEVEAALRELPAIREVVVVAQDEANGGRQLIAYLVMDCDVKPFSKGQTSFADIPLSELRSQLLLKLPDYMIPSQFVVVPEFPLTPNGKLDRKALPSLDGTELAGGSEYEAPRNDLESKLTDIWQSVLNREQIGIRDNFFEVGGHSLLAVMVGARISQELGLHVPLRLLFEHPSVAELTLHLQTKTEGTSIVGPIPRISRDQPLPASFGQQRMWLLQQMLPDPATYNVPIAWRFTGDIDGDRLQQCLQQLMQRHEILRTSFAMQGDQLTQQIFSAADMVLPWNRIEPQSPSSGLRPPPPPITGEKGQTEQLEISCEKSPLAPESGERDRVRGGLDSQLRDEARHLFDLTNGPLWRAAWLTVADNDHFLMLTFHHSIVDEWSLRLLGEELQQLYVADGSPDATALPKLAVQYADYSVWRRQPITGDRLESLRQYWREQLYDLPEPLELPADLPRPQRSTGQGAIHEFELAASVIQPLRELARQEGTTLFTVLLAAFHVWLHRYTQQTDIVVATPHTTRNHPELEAVFGFFLNTLPVRARLERSLSFRETVRKVHDTLMSAYSHAELPFEQMVELAVHDRHAGMHPLHQVMFVLLDEGVPALNLSGLTAEPISVNTGTSKCDLTLSVLNTEGKWLCQWEYDTDLFFPETVTRMSGHWAQMLTSVVENPEQSIGRLELMSAAERHQILVEWNNTTRDYPRDKCVHELFEEHAARTPDAVAVVFEDQSLTYAELNGRANQLARHLQSLGVGPEVLVGLCVDRSLEMIIGLLGILKACGAYVPLDPDYPDERLNFIAQDSEIRVLLTQRDLQHGVDTTALHVLFLDEFSWQAGHENSTSRTSSTGLVYVIYTSGSTGQPKGVEISHRALVNCVTHFRNQLHIDADAVWLAITTLSFDIAGLEIWLPLLTGARCIVASSETAMDGRLLSNAIEKYGVTVLQATPATWKLLLHSKWTGNTHLQLLCGGESLTRELADSLLTLGSPAWNVYGPTEATIWATELKLTAHQTITIGVPIANTTCYVLDANFRPVPQGLKGDLYIGGDCLARGYHNRGDLTADRFVANPFSAEAGSRLYRTGDLARYRANGNIEFLGRSDFQVKLRGFRIELGEIEAALLAIIFVGDAVVLARQDAGGDTQLVACLVIADDRVQDSEVPETTCNFSILRSEICLALSATLPDYMIPSHLVIVRELPLTPNGKLDRKALRDLAGAEVSGGSEYEAPRNQLESQLADIWQSVLNREQVGIRDNFFELGGHSLIAAKLVAEIRDRLGRSLLITDMFQSPTVELLAQRISGHEWNPRWTSLVPLQPLGENLPLFCLHGWGGSAFGFLELAKELNPDRPVYGLQAVGLDSSVPKHTTVEEMARHYVSEMRMLQPHGPYHLAGQSLGGWIAYAVAQELTAQGEKVAFMALLDTQASTNVGWSVYLQIGVPPLFRKGLYHIKRASLRPAGERWQYLKLRLKWLLLHLPGVRRELSVQPVNIHMPPDVDAGRIIDYFDAIVVNYRPRSYDGDVVVFAGSDQESFPHKKFWKKFVRGNVDFYRVAGNHDSLISQQNVKNFAVLFRRLLDESAKQFEKGVCPK